MIMIYAQLRLTSIKSIMEAQRSKCHTLVEMRDEKTTRRSVLAREHSKGMEVYRT